MDAPAPLPMPDAETLRRSRLIGFALIVASTAFFGLAGIFTKSTAEDVWTITWWRGLTGGLIILAYHLWRTRGVATRLRFGLGWRGLLLAGVGSCASIAFIGSFKLTYVANVAVVYATAPFMAAALEWAALGERVRRPTIITACVCLAGVAIMAIGGMGAGNYLGDALAVLMTLGGAIYLVMIRAFRDTPVMLAGATSAFILVALTSCLIDPLDVSLNDAMVMSTFGITYAFALILWTEGAKLITAAESGLLGSAEVPFAVVFSWLILAELPPPATFIGGSVVLVAVAVYAMRDIMGGRASRRRAAKPTV